MRTQIKKTAIYLDYNAGAPLHPRVQAALFAFLETANSEIGNPSSIHSHGRRAKRLMSDAREAIAQSLGTKVDHEQLVMTSSGTEANQLAIRSHLKAGRANNRKTWITSTVEHDSVLQLIPEHEALGGRVLQIPVLETGVLDLQVLSDWLKDLSILDDLALVSTVWVNNETGVISPVQELNQILDTARTPKGYPIPLHLDAAQVWGKLRFDANTSGASTLSFSGHKLGAPAGTGILWVRAGTRIASDILGKQEKGRRGGTENLMGFIGLGAACLELTEKAKAGSLDTELRYLETLRDRLENVISSTIPGTIVNGQKAPRIGQTLNLCFDGIEGDGLVMALDLAGYSVSAGSACASGVLEPSHVLLAMGRSKAQSMAALRISIGGIEEIPSKKLEGELEGFISALEQAVKRLRQARMAWQ